MAAIKYPTVEELIALNRRILQEIQVRKADRHQTLKHGALHHLLCRVQSEGTDIHDKAAVLLMQLIRQHPSASGSRRTAFTATRAFLEMNGATLSAERDECVLTGIREAFYSAAEVKGWLQRHGIRSFRSGQV